MMPETQQWADRAEEDWNSLAVLFRARGSTHHNNICFLAQQCAEKYLKARLVEADIVFPKTHNLGTLLDLALPVEPLWSALRPALAVLTLYGVSIRYPDDSATRDDAKEARILCRTIRAVVRPALGLDN